MADSINTDREEGEESTDLGEKTVGELMEALND